MVGSCAHTHTEIDLVLFSTCVCARVTHHSMRTNSAPPPLGLYDWPHSSEALGGPPLGSARFLRVKVEAGALPPQRARVPSPAETSASLQSNSAATIYHCGLNIGRIASLCLHQAHTHTLIVDPFRVSNLLR